ncbi:glycosyltransferase family 2 protein [Streptococcus suis]|uniref:glycosyltransferase family 2 protein n=1 Tax=Streptococcus suis TaxID=1307 RepID=UPI0037DA145A
MEKPLISVIVPIYNVENYLRQCLDSIIGQTYQNLEILLIDDASTDNSVSICQEYQARDERICLLKKNMQFWCSKFTKFRFRKHDW